jgi:putative transposase
LMGRVGRVVIEGIPHHIVQRGSRRQQAFFSDSDYGFYINIMRKRCRLHEVEIWAYCLMPNHIHLIAVPRKPKELSRAIGEAHRYYALKVNDRQEWAGHLWQERFSSYPMDESYLLTAARYIERNPVVAGLTGSPEAWRWSSARAHLAGRDDALVTVAPLLNLVSNWRAFLREVSQDTHIYQTHERTGLPMGDRSFLKRCEQAVGRPLNHGKPGPKPRP